MDDFDKLKKKCLDNIDEDRKLTKDFIHDLLLEINTHQTTHAYCGTTLSKYVETLQRSNEQLVKILSSEKKKEKDTVTSKDLDDVYDEISETNSKTRRVART